MISETVLRRALGRMALLKYFPFGNPDAVAEVAEMFAELCSTDAEVEHVVKKLLRDPDMAEWPGAGRFFEWLKFALHDGGMVKRDGRWVPWSSLPWTGTNPYQELPG